MTGPQDNRDLVAARFFENGSPNYNDSGFFSVQVISRALQIWGLEMTPIGSTTMREAKAHPEQQKAFICNFDQHWLTLRQFGDSPDRWYDLNSTASLPKPITATYLGMYLQQLETEGYSIFVITGQLPVCDGDQEAELVPVPPKDTELDKAIKMSMGQLVDEDLDKAINMSMGQSDDAELQRAIQASLHEADHLDSSLAQALALSRQDNDWSRSIPPVALNNSRSIRQDNQSNAVLCKGVTGQVIQPTPQPAQNIDPDEIRRRRLQRFSKQ